MTFLEVPFLDLGATYRELQEEIDRAVSRVLSSGWYVLGPEVEAFEREFAEYCGAQHCVGVANGLDALTLSLAAAGVGPGDEVIVPSNTYIATWLAVRHVGATPVPVEPDAASYNIDADRIADALTPRTRAIVPVHLYGLPADMGPIRTIADERNLFLLDDAAQAHGARYRGRRVGALGDATAWSFYPGKNLGAYGDGGAITTDDTSLADRLRVMRNYGSRVKYENEVIGWNSRLDPVQAAILRVKLTRLDEWNARRRAIAGLYRSQLRDLPWLRLPLPDDDARVAAIHLFVVSCASRDDLQAHLASCGVQTLIHYPIAPHRQQAFGHLSLVGAGLEIADTLQGEVLSLPMGPHLSHDAAMHVIDCIRSFRPSSR